MQNLLSLSSFYSTLVFLMMWTDAQVLVLINERRENNDCYHDLIGNGKRVFWKGVSSKINLQFGTNYSGQHCKEKFLGLVRAHKVSGYKSFSL